MAPREQDFLLYEKLVTLPIGEEITELPEYDSFSRSYPHIAVSIGLKREFTRLSSEVKTADREKSSKIRRQMDDIRLRLRQEGILKRLKGERKAEALFRRWFLHTTLKRRLVSFTNSLVTSTKTRLSLIRTLARQRWIDWKKAGARSSRRRFPPSLFDLGSLYVAEKGLALQEWIRAIRKDQRDLIDVENVK